MKYREIAPTSRAQHPASDAVENRDYSGHRDAVQGIAAGYKDELVVVDAGNVAVEQVAPLSLSCPATQCPSPTANSTLIGRSYLSSPRNISPFSTTG